MPNALTRTFQKALELLAPQPSQYGYWLGDPVMGGVWIDGRTFGGHWGNGTFDYKRAVGDGLDSSIVVACLNAIAWQAPEPPPCVYRVNVQGEGDRQVGHPLERLLRRPNPFMSWELLAGYIAYAQHLTGNAILWKARSEARRVVELWPIPPSHIEPAWKEGATTQTWISHYAYRPDPNKEAVPIPPEDIVHLRLNLDPDNMRKGRSPLASVLREIFTDEEASAFLAALLRNYGVPPVILTPKPVAGAPPPTEAQLEKMKEVAKQKFGGERRGEAMFVGVPLEAQKVGYSPAELDLDKLRLLPESRVCAVLGVPAIVAHLYVGVQHATYNNTGGLREHFVESKMIPWWRLLSSDLTHALVPEFAEPGQLEVRFDLSDVRALQEDQDAKYKRMTDALRSGGVTLNTFNRELGLPDLGEAGEVLYLPINVVPTKPEALIAEPEPEPAPRAAVTELPPPPEQEGKVLPAPAFKASDADAAFSRWMLRQREAFAKRLRGEVDAYFRGLAKRTQERYEARQGSKAAGDDLIPEDEAKGLVAVLQASAQAVGEATFEMASDRLGTDVAWDLQNPNVTRYLSQSSERVKGIMDTTRAELRAALEEGEAAGEGISELAKRVRSVVEESYKNRGETIARTEVGTAQQRAAILGYRESGVVSKVRVLDGTDHDDECRAANGKEWDLDYAAAHPLQHPNCTRCFSPIVTEA